MNKKLLMIFSILLTMCFILGNTPKVVKANGISEKELKQYKLEEAKEIEKIKKKIPELIEQLKAERWFKRERAILELSRTHDPRVVEPIVNVILSDTNLSIRKFAIERIGILGHSMDENKDLRENLKKFAVPVLKKMLNEKDLRPKVAEALWNLKEREIAFPILIEEKQFDCLVASKDKRVIPYLKEELQSKDAVRRWKACASLVEFGEKNIVIPVLKEMIKNNNDEVTANQAKQLLKKIEEDK